MTVAFSSFVMQLPTDRCENDYLKVAGIKEVGTIVAKAKSLERVTNSNESTYLRPLATRSTKPFF